MARVQNFDGDGTVSVSVGDSVNFKSDVEQHGVITKIDGPWLTLHNPNGFPGDYLRYATETVEHQNDCWKEN